MEIPEQFQDPLHVVAVATLCGEDRLPAFDTESVVGLIDADGQVLRAGLREDERVTADVGGDVTRIPDPLGVDEQVFAGAKPHQRDGNHGSVSGLREDDRILLARLEKFDRCQDDAVGGCCVCVTAGARPDQHFAVNLPVQCDRFLVKKRFILVHAVMLL